MTEIDIQLLNEKKRKLKNLSDKLYKIDNSFSAIRNNMDWQLKSKSNINEKMKQINIEIGFSYENLNKEIGFFGLVADGYGNAEEQIEKRLKAISQGGTTERKNWFEKIGEGTRGNEINFLNRFQVYQKSVTISDLKDISAYFESSDVELKAGYIVDVGKVSYLNNISTTGYDISTMKYKAESINDANTGIGAFLKALVESIRLLIARAIALSVKGTDKTVMYKDGDYIVLDSNDESGIIDRVMNGWTISPPIGLRVYKDGHYAVITTGELPSYLNNGWSFTPYKVSEGTGKVDSPLYNYTKEMVNKITTTNPKFDNTVNDFKQAYLRNKSVYDEIAKKAGVPPELIAIIHYRENTPDFLAGRFNIYLHNGEKLGKVTEKVPKGKYFTDFTVAATDAFHDQQSFIDKYKLSSNSKDIIAIMSFAEVYNGLGYYNNGKVSPYLYSGTNLYTSGKYIEERDSNGKYRSIYKENLVDDQVGVYLLLHAIME